jgi:hypothetical protein
MAQRAGRIRVDLIAGAAESPNFQLGKIGKMGKRTGNPRGRPKGAKSR